jgi:pimeloyl-ACP methyl ester carboxylesterase
MLIAGGNPMNRLATIVLSALSVVILGSLVGGCRIMNRTAEASRVIAPGLLEFGESPPAEGGLGLYTLTPYDPHRIPVVMVHGLVSDSTCWDPMLAELRKDAQLDANYQFWIFRYPTDDSFLKSAANLRASLTDAIRQLDPTQQNPRMSQLVLIGHSVGGLLAKLQITYSDHKLWDAVATKPIDELDLDLETRDSLRDSLFFEPQPMVRRVIYLGVPHGGSAWNESLFERWGDRLVRFPQAVRDSYQRMIDDNAGALLIDPATGVPTSIDHLSPESPILQATNELRRVENVAVHSIMGNTDRLYDGSSGDGMVSVDSARIKADSEWYVDATHNEIQRAEQSIREVKRILLEHLEHTANSQ